MSIGFDVPLYILPFDYCDGRAAAINRRCAAGEKAVK